MASNARLDCPSASHENPEAKLLGVALDDEDAGDARIAYVDKETQLPEDFDVEGLGVDPGHALRFSAPCMNNGCGQWRDGGCGLGKAILEQLAPVVDVAPACTLRATCRWFAENGTASCLRCPQITTRRHKSQVIRVPRSPMGPPRPELKTEPSPNDASARHVDFLPLPARDPDGGATVRI